MSWASKVKVTPVGRQQQQRRQATSSTTAAAAAAASTAAAWPIKSPSPLVDIGINLLPKNFPDARRVVETARQANVSTLIITGTSLRDSIDALEMCARMASDEWQSSSSGGVTGLCTVGVHPHNASKCNDDTIKTFRQMFRARPGMIAAIGETGLDYNRMRSPREVQLRWFREHVKLAIDLDMPMFLHEREAHADFIAVLDEVKHKYGKLPPMVVHCFTGTADEAREYIARGLYIGLTTFISKENRGAEGRDILRRGIIPLNRLMVETDGPYMLPSMPRHLKSHFKFEKGRNEPCTLPFAVRTIADCLDTTEQAVAEATTNNAKVFFRLVAIAVYNLLD